MMSQFSQCKEVFIFKLFLEVFNLLSFDIKALGKIYFNLE